MKEMLEFSDLGFKTIINILRMYWKITYIMQKQMYKVIREMTMLRKFQKKVPIIKITVTEIKKYLHSVKNVLINRLGMAKERICELEIMAMKTFKPEMQIEK